MAVYRATDGVLTIGTMKVWWVKPQSHGLTKIHLRRSRSMWKTLCGIPIPEHGAHDGPLQSSTTCGRCQAVLDARPGVWIEVVKPITTGGYSVWLCIGRRRASLLTDSRGISWWSRRCDATKVANWWASWIVVQQHTKVPIIYREGRADA